MLAHIATGGHGRIPVKRSKGDNTFLLPKFECASPTANTGPWLPLNSKHGSN